MPVTFAQMPGTMSTVEIPTDHVGPFTLRDVLARGGVDPDTIGKKEVGGGKTRTRSLAVNGTVTTDLDTPVPDGATVLLTENIVGG